MRLMGGVGARIEPRIKRDGRQVLARLPSASEVVRYICGIVKMYMKFMRILC